VRTLHERSGLRAAPKPCRLATQEPLDGSCPQTAIERGKNRAEIGWTKPQLHSALLGNDPGYLEKLVELAREQIASGSPPPYQPPRPQPVQRRWPPVGVPDGRLGRIISARPELGIDEAADKRKPRVSRSATEGWRGRTHSLKAGEVVAWNGRLVDAEIRQADADAEVSSLVGSPLTLAYYTPRGWRHRSPHLLEIRSGVPWLIDCFWEVTASRKEEMWRQIGAGEP
jgi:hypothetical protein